MSIRPVRGLTLMRGRLRGEPSRPLCTSGHQDIPKKSPTMGSEVYEEQGGLLTQGWSRLEGC